MPPKKKRHNKKKKSPTSEPLMESKHREMLPFDDYIGQNNLIIENSPCTSSKKSVKVEKLWSNGVKRIYLPFNRFPTQKRPDLKKKMTYHSQYKVLGLSPKEKSFIICSCQSKANRYPKLKIIAANAIKDKKIFTIYGTCNPIRKALLERGWVEKIQANKMNLSKIRNGKILNKTEIYTELERLLLSNLLEKYTPNFVWNDNDTPNETIIDMKMECTTIVNRLDLNAPFTTKQGLCSSMKHNYWFYIEDVAEVNAPRTYNTYDTGEKDSFVRDFKITACTSLLKWILSMVANEQPIFDNSGKISIDILVFALNRCKEYLFRKQNKDIDCNLSGATTVQWNSFLKNYYNIISNVEVFQADMDNRPMYLDYAMILLKEMHRYRPQLRCEGCHNIWIIKPAHCSRGRGIRMASKLGVITNLLNKANSKYVIQKYVEEPLLIHETKFDIRQYYLVTSTYPLVIWMYRDCYLKFSSQKYNLKNYHESIHLTNNAVQKKYMNCNNRHPDLPQHNMWDLDTYKEYLKCMGKIKVWDNVIYPGMRRSIIGIMLSCQDTLSVTKNRFELYGCDFILDKKYQPWLIEINSCPDLNHTTQVTSKICPALIGDIVKVVIDYRANSKSPTGNFECIYHQPLTVPRYGGAADLVVKGYALPNEYFYKGPIELKDSFELSKDIDMKEILKTLKAYYEQDIMVVPDDDDDHVNMVHLSDDNTEAIDCEHITKSENELNTAATVITGQLDDLLDRITCENTDSSKSIHNLKSLEYLSIDYFSNFKVKSLSDLLSLVMKLSSSNNKGFQFSELDDEGPSGKGGFFHYENLKKVLFDMDLSPVKGNTQIMLKSVISKTNFKDNNITGSMSKLLSFINDKVMNEYLN